ncbi:Gfo/Idh/MocA family protein [Candidatus Hydrogenedentota bacterium]
MTKKINIGFVGCGHMTRDVLGPQAAELDVFHLRAFMDVIEDRATQTCRTFGGDYHTTDINRLLDDDDLDAVVIATLPDSHAELGAAFLDRNKHVSLQKPAAISYEGCRQLAEAERNSEAKAIVAYCRRNSPLLQSVRERIPRPHMQYSHMMVGQMGKNLGKNLADPEQAAVAAMFELACHHVDTAYWLARSRPLTVYASGGTLLDESENIIDNFAMLVTFENASVATLVSGSGSGRSPGKRRKWYAEIYGGGVSAIIDGFRYLTFVEDGEETIEYTDYRTAVGLHKDMEVLRDTIQGRIESPCTVADGIVATLLMLRAFDSMKSGQAESIDMDRFMEGQQNGTR